jgi:hypothetical protein
MVCLAYLQFIDLDLHFEFKVCNREGQTILDRGQGMEGSRSRDSR